MPRTTPSPWVVLDDAAGQRPGCRTRRCAAGGSGRSLTIWISSATGAAESISWPVMLWSPSRIPLQRADLDPVDADGVGQLVHQRLVRERGLHAAEAAHRAARRVVRVDAAGVDVHAREVVRAQAQRAAVADHRAGRRGVGAAVEQDVGLAVDQRAVGLARRTRSAARPGAGARGRRTTPRGSSSSSPACRCAARAGRRARASTGPRGRRTRRRRRPGAAGPSPAAARAPGRSAAGRRAATGWRRTGRRRRPRRARRARTPGRGRPGPACRPRSPAPTTTGAVGAGSPRRICIFRTRLPCAWTCGASSSRRLARVGDARAAPRRSPRSASRRAGRSPGGRRRPARPARPRSGRRPAASAGWSRCSSPTAFSPGTSSAVSTA